jgi:heme/copper-type cytochrome/quinol oxidase subunit 4
MNHEHHTQTSGSWWRSRTGLVLLVFLGIIGFFLVTEHTAHVFGFLPYALLLLCPFLHLFMHGGHGGHGGHGDGGNQGKPSDWGKL